MFTAKIMSMGTEKSIESIESIDKKILSKVKTGKY